MIEEDFYKQATLRDTEEVAVTAPSMPSEIGGYRIESLLSKGGMSLLYFALDNETSEPRIIKVLSKEYLGHPEMVERFLNEAKMIEMTSHPNIVRVFGHGRWEGGVYIALEFIQGISLRQMILQQMLPLRRSLEIVLQIAHAITHLHAHGIIHRDLKPENILLTDQGGIKVIDFGIAALYTEKVKGKKRILGTPAYMSPEQREDLSQVSFASDIYSLGVIAYELVLGRLCHGVIHLSLIPKGLQRILSKALQPKVENRYEDIVDFIKDLSLYLSSDEMKKDMRGSDYLGELGMSLKEASALVVPIQLPSWPHHEVSLIASPSEAISSVYYDFFSPALQTFSLMLAESIKTGVEALMGLASLKSMMNALLPRIPNESELIAAINELVLKEAGEPGYTMGYLTLFPREDRFSYLNCGYHPIWHIPHRAETFRRESTDNVALGFTSAFSPLHLDGNWNVGDSLILYALQGEPLKGDIIHIEKDFEAALQENLHLAPKIRLEAIFRKITKPDRTLDGGITLISVTRTD